MGDDRRGVDREGLTAALIEQALDVKQAETDLLTVANRLPDAPSVLNLRELATHEAALAHQMHSLGMLIVQDRLQRPVRILPCRCWVCRLQRWWND